jgi:S-adenosylmethionine:diacylglycerol 3-amino-3-carboxypropyl transferase
MNPRDPETPWLRGRFDARRGPSQLLFGRMYEDSAIEERAFRPGGRIFCIASAGCTARDLSHRHDVVAVDVNPVQIAYAERRASGAPALPGKAERMLARIRRLAPLAGWRRARLREFLELDDPGEQLAFWRFHLDRARFRAATDAIFSQGALRAVYARAFLGGLPRRFGAILRARLERGFARHPNRRNPYLRALLLGEPARESSSAEPGRIRFVHAEAAAFLERQPPMSFDGFSISNVLDGASGDYRARLFAAMSRAASPGAVVVGRSFAEPTGPLPANLAADDRAMLWGIVDVRSVASL